jgi:hypothetical protein
MNRHSSVVQRIGGDELVAAELQRDRQHALGPGEDVLERDGLHLGDADLADDEERRHEEQQQEQEGQRDDEPTPTKGADHQALEGVHRRRTHARFTA